MFLYNINIVVHNSFGVTMLKPRLKNKLESFYKHLDEKFDLCKIFFKIGDFSARLGKKRMLQQKMTAFNSIFKKISLRDGLAHFPMKIFLTVS